MNFDGENNIKTSSSRYRRSEFCEKLNYVYTSRQCDEYLDYLEELRRIIFGENYYKMEVTSESISYHTNNGKTLVYQFEEAANYGISLSSIPSETETVTTETFLAEQHVLPTLDTATVIPPETCRSEDTKLLHQLPMEIDERMKNCLHASAELISTLSNEHRPSYIYYSNPYARTSFDGRDDTCSENESDYNDRQDLDEHVDEDFAVLEDFATVLEESESVFEEVDDYTEDLDDFIISNDEVVRVIHECHLEWPVVADVISGFEEALSSEQFLTENEELLPSPAAFSTSSWETVIERKLGQLERQESIEQSEELDVEDLPEAAETKTVSSLVQFFEKVAEKSRGNSPSPTTASTRNMVTPDLNDLQKAHLCVSNAKPITVEEKEHKLNDIASVPSISSKSVQESSQEQLQKSGNSISAPHSNGPPLYSPLQSNSPSLGDNQSIKVENSHTPMVLLANENSCSLLPDIGTLQHCETLFQADEKPTLESTTNDDDHFPISELDDDFSIGGFVEETNTSCTDPFLTSGTRTLTGLSEWKSKALASNDPMDTDSDSNSAAVSHSKCVLEPFVPVGDDRLSDSVPDHSAFQVDCRFSDSSDKLFCKTDDISTFPTPSENFHHAAAISSDSELVDLINAYVQMVINSPRQLILSYQNEEKEALEDVISQTDSIHAFHMEKFDKGGEELAAAEELEGKLFLDNSGNERNCFGEDDKLPEILKGTRKTCQETVSASTEELLKADVEDGNVFSEKALFNEEGTENEPTKIYLEDHCENFENSSVAESQEIPSETLGQTVHMPETTHAMTVEEDNRDFIVSTHDNFESSNVTAASPQIGAGNRFEHHFAKPEVSMPSHDFRDPPSADSENVNKNGSDENMENVEEHDNNAETENLHSAAPQDFPDSSLKTNDCNQQSIIVHSLNLTPDLPNSPLPEIEHSHDTPLPKIEQSDDSPLQKVEQNQNTHLSEIDHGESHLAGLEHIASSEPLSDSVVPQQMDNDGFPIRLSTEGEQLETQQFDQSEKSEQAEEVSTESKEFVGLFEHAAQYINEPESDVDNKQTEKNAEGHVPIPTISVCHVSAEDDDERVERMRKAVLRSRSIIDEICKENDFARSEDVVDLAKCEMRNGQELNTQEESTEPETLAPIVIESIPVASGDQSTNDHPAEISTEDELTDSQSNGFTVEEMSHETNNAINPPLEETSHLFAETIVVTGTKKDMDGGELNELAKKIVNELLETVHHQDPDCVVGVAKAEASVLPNSSDSTSAPNPGVNENNILNQSSQSVLNAFANVENISSTKSENEFDDSRHDEEQETEIVLDEQILKKEEEENKHSQKSDLGNAEKIAETASGLVEEVLRKVTKELDATNATNSSLEECSANVVVKDSLETNNPSESQTVELSEILTIETLQDTNTEGLGELEDQSEHNEKADSEILMAPQLNAPDSHLNEIAETASDLVEEVLRKVTEELDYLDATSRSLDKSPAKDSIKNNFEKDSQMEVERVEYDQPEDTLQDQEDSNVIQYVKPEDQSDHNVEAVSKTELAAPELNTESPSNENALDNESVSNEVISSKVQEDQSNDTSYNHAAEIMDSVLENVTDKLPMVHLEETEAHDVTDADAETHMESGIHDSDSENSTSETLEHVTDRLETPTTAALVVNVANDSFTASTNDQQNNSISDQEEQENKSISNKPEEVYAGVGTFELESKELNDNESENNFKFGSLIQPKDSNSSQPSSIFTEQQTALHTEVQDSKVEVEEFSRPTHSDSALRETDLTPTTEDSKDRAVSDDPPDSSELPTNIVDDCEPTLHMETENSDSPNGTLAEAIQNLCENSPAVEEYNDGSLSTPEFARTDNETGRSETITSFDEIVIDLDTVKLADTNDNFVVTVCLPEADPILPSDNEVVVLATTPIKNAELKYVKVMEMEATEEKHQSLPETVVEEHNLLQGPHGDDIENAVKEIMESVDSLMNALEIGLPCQRTGSDTSPDTSAPDSKLTVVSHDTLNFDQVSTMEENTEFELPKSLSDATEIENQNSLPPFAVESNWSKQVDGNCDVTLLPQSPPRKQSESGGSTDARVVAFDHSHEHDSKNVSVKLEKQQSSTAEESPSELPGSSSVVEEVSYFLTTVCVAALAFGSPSESGSGIDSNPDTDIIEDASKYMSSHPNSDNRK